LIDSTAISLFAPFPPPNIPSATGRAGGGRGGEKRGGRALPIRIGVRGAQSENETRSWDGASATDIAMMKKKEGQG